jgi:hypothetical protein
MDVKFYITQKPCMVNYYLSKAIRPRENIRLWSIHVACGEDGWWNLSNRSYIKSTIRTPTGMKVVSK